MSTADPRASCIWSTLSPTLITSVWLILLVCIAQLMLPVDSAVVNVALPSAQRALEFSKANRSGC